MRSQRGMTWKRYGRWSYLVWIRIIAALFVVTVVVALIWTGEWRNALDMRRPVPVRDEPEAPRSARVHVALSNGHIQKDSGTIWPISVDYHFVKGDPAASW